MIAIVPSSLVGLGKCPQRFTGAFVRVTMSHCGDGSATNVWSTGGEYLCTLPIVGASRETGLLFTCTLSLVEFLGADALAVIDVPAVVEFACDIEAEVGLVDREGSLHSSRSVLGSVKIREGMFGQDYLFGFLPLLF